MNCIDPGATSPDDLMACAEDDCTPSVSRHVQRCAACTAEVAAYARANKRLRARFFRLLCPPAETLADYEFGLLSDTERSSTRTHVGECPRCQAELETLHEFVRDDEPVLAGDGGIVGAIRRVLATAFAPGPQPALSTLRGTVETSSGSYRAESYSITLTQAPDPRSGRVTLTGLVWDADAGTELLGDAALLDAGSGTVQTAPIDDLGNFTLESVVPGTYSLELRFPRLTVAVESLHIGG